MDKWKKGGMPFQVSVREPVVEVSVCVWGIGERPPPLDASCSVLWGSAGKSHELNMCGIF